MERAPKPAPGLAAPQRPHPCTVPLCMTELSHSGRAGLGSTLECCFTSRPQPQRWSPGARPACTLLLISSPCPETRWRFKRKGNFRNTSSSRVKNTFFSQLQGKRRGQRLLQCMAANWDSCFRGRLGALVVAARSLNPCNRHLFQLLSPQRVFNLLVTPLH